MTCEYCHGTGWLLSKKDAPSPPYEEGHQLEYANRCVCHYESQKFNQDYQNREN
jgi:hypothetical protein